ncbi:hypothetical protein KY285_010638 [Solanum tuberosum]|nr:hypothetical protein KY289_011187 [Solanum tuberosum]KAH0734931.1 hypothetical protein KY285_010638 [Solanum tuberosum]
MAILQDTPPQSEEGCSRSGSIEESGSEYNVGLGSQSADNSGGSAKSESGSQEDANTSPPAVNTESETGVREEIDVLDGHIEIISDDIMTVNRSEEFFNNGIVTKTGGFKRRAIMPET